MIQLANSKEYPEGLYNNGNIMQYRATPTLLVFSFLPHGNLLVNSIPVSGVSVGNSNTATSIKIKLGFKTERYSSCYDDDTDEMATMRSPDASNTRLQTTPGISHHELPMCCHGY